MTGPIRDTTGERAQDMFVESPTRSGKTSVETIVSNLKDAINSPLYGVEWNNFTYDYPSSTQEVITLKQDLINKAIITLNYTDSTKQFLTSGIINKL